MAEMRLLGPFFMAFSLAFVSPYGARRSAAVPWETVYGAAGEEYEGAWRERHPKEVGLPTSADADHSPETGGKPAGNRIV